MYMVWQGFPSPLQQLNYNLRWHINHKHILGEHTPLPHTPLGAV